MTIAFRDLQRIVGHIQVASVPSRHEPDGEELNYSYLFSEFDRLGYAGYVGCEYNPRAGTARRAWLAPALQEGLTMPLLLGAVADDYTGASDLANTLSRNGLVHHSDHRRSRARICRGRCGRHRGGAEDPLDRGRDGGRGGDGRVRLARGARGPARDLQDLLHVRLDRRWQHRACHRCVPRARGCRLRPGDARLSRDRAYRLSRASLRRIGSSARESVERPSTQSDARFQSRAGARAPVESACRPHRPADRRAGKREDCAPAR